MEETLKLSTFRLAATLLVIGLGVFGIYEYQTSQSLESELNGVKNQVATLAESSAVSSQESLTTAVAKASPAVVSIIISKDVPRVEVQYENPFGSDPRFRYYSFRMPVYKQVGTEHQDIGAGSGFIVREDGYIITNRHVVADPAADYTVLMSNGTQKFAKVVYTDTTNDIAVIKITGTGYPTVSLGDSSAIVLGQSVATIGNALGEYNNTVSVGIISGLDRTVDASDVDGNEETLKGMIQTDAAVNLGNSGGPLIDLAGKVVGVNVATVVGSNSIAFSIPINVVKDILDRVL